LIKLDDVGNECLGLNGLSDTPQTGDRQERQGKTFEHNRYVWRNTKG
jgi:hypothetical protein